jgi:amino acid adenylation domain-containing protein
VVDLSGLPESGREAAARTLAAAEAARPFDLARGPLLRSVLLRLAEDDHLAALTMHHIVSDGWSMGILVREVTALYAAFAEGRPSPLAELPVQYADFSAWQRSWLHGEVLEDEISFWRQQLAGLPPLLKLPTDRPRPAAQSFRGASRPVRLPAGLIGQARTLSRSQGATLFMVLLAGFQALLARSSGQDDLAVGTPVAGRNRMEIEGLIGFFVNTLVLRGDLAGDGSGGPSFRALLGRARETVLAAHLHQDVPFERLVQELTPERSLAQTPLFQVMLVLQNVPAETLEIRDLRLRPVGGARPTTRFDLTLSLEEHDGGLSGAIEHSTDLFDAATIDRLILHFERLLGAALAAPELPAPELPLLTEAERHQALAEWNDTGAGETESLRLHELFEVWAERTPAAPSVLLEGGAAVPYGELEAMANRIAHRLLALGAGPESRVGLCVQRSPEALAALLGVLKAGAAYVPLDPASPRERLAAIAADAGMAILLTQERLAPALAGLADRLVTIDAPAERLADERPERPVCRALPDNAAYVIYTSGSTGAAKGVVATHRNAAHFTRAFARVTGLGPDDRLLLFAPLSFDASVLQIFPPLASGAALVVHPDPRELASHEILALCERSGMTVLDLPAALWRQWVEDVAAQRLALPSSLRAFLTGGESVSVARLRTWAGLAGRPLSFLSSYGPTEATVTATVFTTWNHRVPSLAGATVPLGRPLSGTRVYVVDRALQPAPCGMPGELFLAGAGLARGYLRQPDLTADAFRPDPFAAEAGGRLYRTGDLAVRRPDGGLEFLGRVDHQVKLRGFRVELGEIEAALLRHPGLREAAVVVREDRPGDRRLAAYVVPREREEPPSPAELRDFLIQRLPGYMIPAAVMLLPEIPVLASGKLDRAALPEPVHAEAGERVAPRTPVEQLLAGIWSEVLGVEPVGAFDSFFDLGGHSLAATRVVSRIRKELQIDLELRSLFEAPTVAALAEGILADPERRDRVERAAELTLQLSALSEEEIEAMLVAESPVPAVGEGA